MNTLKKQKIVCLHSTYPQRKTNDTSLDLMENILEQLSTRTTAARYLQELCETKKYKDLEIDQIVHFNFIDRDHCVVLVEYYDDKFH